MEHYGVQVHLLVDKCSEWTLFRLRHTFYFGLYARMKLRERVPAGRSKLPLLSYHLMSMTQCYMCVPDENVEKCVLYDVAALCKIVCV